LKRAPSPRYLIADSKLYHADHAPHLQHLGCITRLPHTIGSVSEGFATPEAAQEALTALAKGWMYHLVDSYSLSDHTRDARTGRPTPSTPVKALDW
jgi:hypothetical protein